MRASALALRNLSGFAALSLTLILAGCGMSGGTGSGGATSSSGFGSIQLKGQAHGGRQPVVGATVTVYAAGNTGYGSTAVQLATTTSDANGNFFFGASSSDAIVCPSTTSTTASEILYVTATGGQPTTGVTNAQSVMLSVLGDCRTLENLQSYIAINEVSTVTGMTAMAHFFNPATESFGAPASNVLGLTNAAATAATLQAAATSATGAITENGSGDASITGATITVTSENTKVNLEANVLAACINTGGTGSSSPVCGQLFGYVNSTAATDTLQATYYMATNPTDTVGGTSNITSVYGLSAGTGAPYQPTATSATDWTLGLTYGTKSQGTTGALPFLLQSPEYVAADAQGNIWVANYTSGAGAQATTSAVTELSPTGIPQKQVLAGAFGKPSGMIVDALGNVDVADALNGQVVQYTLSGTKNLIATGTGTYSLAGDGMGNLFVANKTTGTILKVPAGSTTPATAATLTMTFPEMAFDSNYNLWVASGTGVSQFLYSNSYATATTAATGSYESIGVDPSNNIWSANYATTGESLVEIPATNSATIPTPNNITAASGLYDTKQILSDSAGNIFIVNAKSTTGGIVEYSNAGALISPAAGYTHTEYISQSETIDQAGNVWYGSEETNGTYTAFITEIVGVAAPTIAPLAAQLPGAPSSIPTAKATLVFSSLPPAYDAQGAGFTYPATLAATSTSPAVNPATATGTFSLVYNGTTICSVSGPFVPGANISCPVTSSVITSLPADTYTVLATYSGDATYAASSTPITLTVEPSTTATTGVTGFALSGPTGTGIGIVGATVTLYATNSYGTAVTSNPTTPTDVGAGYYTGTATVLGTTTTAAGGAFTLPAFTCANVDDLYVAVSGGETSGTTSNASSLLVAALGACSAPVTLNPVVNEVTTAAAAYTLAGFMSVNGTAVNITSSANNYATPSQTTGTMYHPVGLQHAFLNAANLADVTTGTAKVAMAGYTGTTVPILPAQLINSVANTLSACTQTAGNCTAILSAATTLSTTPVAATTTLGAALNIARNPYMGGAGKAATWLGLSAGGSAPYTPVVTPANAGTVTATPHDLSAGIVYPKGLTYNGTALSNLYGVNATMDANDTFYLVSESTTASPYSYAINAFASTGQNVVSHLFCQGGTTYNQSTCPEYLPSAEVIRLAADPIGNLWLTTYGSSTAGATYTSGQAMLIQITASTGAFANIPANTAAQESTYVAPLYTYSVVADQSSNIYVGTESTTGAIYRFPYSQTTGGVGTSTNIGTTGAGTSTANDVYAYSMLLDDQQNLWSVGYHYTSPTYSQGVAVIPNQSLTSPAYPGSTGGAVPESFTPSTSNPKVQTLGEYNYGIAVDSIGNIYAGSSQSATAGAAGDGINVVSRTYTGNVITGLTAASSLVTGSPISTTNGLVNVAFSEANLMNQDGDGAIYVADFTADTVIRMFGPTGTAIQAYYPCIGATCNATYASGTNLFAIKQPFVDATGTVTAFTTTNGNYMQIFGIGTPSFPLAAAGHPAQMP